MRILQVYHLVYHFSASYNNSYITFRASAARSISLYKQTTHLQSYRCCYPGYYAGHHKTLPKATVLPPEGFLIFSICAFRFCRQTVPCIVRFSADRCLSPAPFLLNPFPYRAPFGTHKRSLPTGSLYYTLSGDRLLYKYSGLFLLVSDFHIVRYELFKLFPLHEFFLPDIQNKRAAGIPQKAFQFIDADIRICCGFRYR